MMGRLKPTHYPWLAIGSKYSVDAKPKTLDAYLKRRGKRGTADWVASVLEADGVVIIDRRQPARIRSAAAPGRSGT
jgi:hypothetical protein